MGEAVAALLVAPVVEEQEREVGRATSRSTAPLTWLLPLRLLSEQEVCLVLGALRQMVLRAVRGAPRISVVSSTPMGVVVAVLAPVRVARLVGLVAVLEVRALLGGQPQRAEAQVEFKEEQVRGLRVLAVRPRLRVMPACMAVLAAAGPISVWQPKQAALRYGGGLVVALVGL